jgi:phosphorylase kinase alpha/beta subunit
LIFARVTLGNLGEFLNTSCITNLSFLGSQEEGLPDSEFEILLIYFLIYWTLIPSELNPQVEKYLNEHMVKSMTQRPRLIIPQNRRGSKPVSVQRKQSVRGAIKKTRSIAVDGIFLAPFCYANSLIQNCSGMEKFDRRVSVYVHPPLPELERSPSPEDEVRPVWKASGVSRQRCISETQYADTEVEELLTMLRETENLEEQGDILQYLADTQGLDYKMGGEFILRALSNVRLSLIIFPPRKNRRWPRRHNQGSFESFVWESVSAKAVGNRSAHCR